MLMYAAIMMLFTGPAEPDAEPCNDVSAVPYQEDGRSFIRVTACGKPLDKADRIWFEVVGPWGCERSDREIYYSDYQVAPGVIDGSRFPKDKDIVIHYDRRRPYNPVLVMPGGRNGERTYGRVPAPTTAAHMFRPLEPWNTGQTDCGAAFGPVEVCVRREELVAPFTLSIMRVPCDASGVFSVCDRYVFSPELPPPEAVKPGVDFTFSLYWRLSGYVANEFGAQRGECVRANVAAMRERMPRPHCTMLGFVFDGDPKFSTPPRSQNILDVWSGCPNLHLSPRRLVPVSLGPCEQGGWCIRNTTEQK